MKFNKNTRLSFNHLYHKKSFGGDLVILGWYCTLRDEIHLKIQQ